MHPIKIKSDKYFNHLDRSHEMEEIGIEVDPVDLNDAYVPKSKDDPLTKTQESIRHRFGLGGE